MYIRKEEILRHKSGHRGHKLFDVFIMTALPIVLVGIMYLTSSFIQIQALNKEISSLKSSRISKTVLVFGDSITEGKPGNTGGWVELLHQHFDELRVMDPKGLNEPTVYNMGVSGNNSTDILKRIESETIKKTYNNNLPIVLIQIGVNDSVKMPIKTYENNLKKIIKKVRPISSKIILVGLSACGEGCSSLYYTERHRSNESLKDFENKMKSVALEEKIEFIPVFDDFKKEFDDGKELLSDGLHPNKDGYAKMYDIISTKLIPLLAE